MLAFGRGANTSERRPDNSRPDREPAFHHPCSRAALSIILGGRVRSGVADSLLTEEMYEEKKPSRPNAYCFR